MEKNYYTYSEFKLGDNIIHINYLKRLASENKTSTFFHFCRKEYLGQLDPFVEDDGNIVLAPLQSCVPGAINAWIGRDDYFYKSPLRYDWCAFHLNWFAHLSSILNVRCPVITKEDFFVDLPRAKRKSPIDGEFDFLVVNSIPTSNQIHDFRTNQRMLADIAVKLERLGFRVISTHPAAGVPCTLDMGLSIAQIGALAKNCRFVVGVPNGPMWAALNSESKKVVENWVFWLSIQSLNISDAFVTCPTAQAFQNAIDRLVEGTQF